MEVLRSPELKNLLEFKYLPENLEIWYKNLLEYKYLPDIKLANTTLCGQENDLVGLKLYCL